MAGGTRRTVGVLGPAEVGGAGLTPRQRTLVAALACHGERGLTVDGLLDAVWGGAVPPSAKPSLQNHIARLRLRFGDDLIVTGAAGYALTWARDADQFEVITNQWVGVAAAPDGITELTAALRLWRGVPYVDLDDHGPSQAEATRLGELRALVAEQLAACRIAAGDLNEAVAELSSLVEDDPYRERRWELLILALHLSGRRSEALLAWGRLTECLQRELGCQPSATVARLVQAVGHDDALDQTDVELHLAGRPSRRPQVAAAVTPGCDRRRRQQRQRTGCAGTYRQT